VVHVFVPRGSTLRAQAILRSRRIASVFGVCLMGCAPQPAEQAKVTVRDSADIRIVESAAPTASDGTWSVDTTPVVRIGQVYGPPEYQLFKVGPLARLSDGTIVVALASELRFFAADGTWLRTVGREGGGPGEYLEIELVRRLRGDSLVVWDRGLRRVTVLAPDGSFVGDALVSHGQGVLVDVMAALDDGWLVTARRVRTLGQSTSYLRDTLSFVVQSAESDTVSVPLARLGGEEWQVRSRGGAASVMLLPFSRDALAAAGADRIYLAESDRFEIRTYTPEGSLRQILRLPTAPAPITSPLLDSLADYWHMEAEAEAAALGYTLPKRPAEQYREETRNLARVPTLPAFTALIVEDAGNLWVREYDPPWRARTASHWAVFAPDGSLLARVAMPSGLDVRCIQGDVVLGTVTDSLGVEYVGGYRLRN